MIRQDDRYVALPAAQAVTAKLVPEMPSASLARSSCRSPVRIERQLFASNGKAIVVAVLDLVEPVAKNNPQGTYLPLAHSRQLVDLREHCLQPEQKLGWEERGAILTLFSSAERALNLVRRIADPCQTVSRKPGKALSSR